MPDPSYLSVSGLKARGWTDALIRRHLGDPDQTRPNPHYRSGAPMRLYALSRVEAIELSDAWTQSATGRASRKGAAAKAVQTKRQRLRTYLEALEISVPRLGCAELTRRACDHYNALQWDRERWDNEPATPASDPAFLERISVNYLRHGLSRYEAELAQVFGKVGVREAYVEINRKVYAAIGAAYPALADECARQMRDKENMRS